MNGLQPEHAMTTEGPESPEQEMADRRSGERQISVLINAGLVHRGDDALCRIRNLSSGGVMIECGLPLKIVWALLDIISIVVLGSGLYLWIARRGVSMDGRLAALAQDDQAVRAGR